MSALSNAAQAVSQFASAHSAAIAGIATGLAVGLGCAALTGGWGAAGCVVAGMTAGAAVNSALSCPPGRSVAGCALRGAATGALAGALLVGTGGLAEAAGLGAITTGALAGAVSGAGGDSLGQYLDTGHVDPVQVAEATAIGGTLGGLGGSLASRPTPGGVTVYRGTSITSELQIHAETGQLMSDAARVGYVESGGSTAAARAASETAHSAGVQAWGSESAYVEAHGAFGTELSQVGSRSMFSVTTDPTVAKYFAGPGGRVFSAVVPRSVLLPQTLDGAGESEFLIRHMLGAQ
jgi:hypothetical protein